jgi:hypothetical protein
MKNESIDEIAADWATDKSVEESLDFHALEEWAKAELRALHNWRVENRTMEEHEEIKVDKEMAGEYLDSVFEEKTANESLR